MVSTQLLTKSQLIDLINKEFPDDSPTKHIALLTSVQDYHIKEINQNIMLLKHVVKEDCF